MRLLAMGGRLTVLGLLSSLVSCLPAQTNRGLERELQTARAEAALEQRRVYELEARLARLEVRTQPAPAAVTPSAGGGDPTLQRQLDMLIALNQELLREARANREQTSVAAASTAAAAVIPALTPAVMPQQMPNGVGPECNTGLTTEQKILELVLTLKGERSPWRVDGLSYEESQALRVLLREERPLDLENPWQRSERPLDLQNPWQ